MKASNSKRDKAFAAMSAGEQEHEKSAHNEIVQGLRDLTDRENKLFRYQG